MTPKNDLVVQIAMRIKEVDTKQYILYDTLCPSLVSDFVHGHDHLSFVAFGPYRNGKTYTIFGDEEDIANETTQGILPRFLHDLMNKLVILEDKTNSQHVFCVSFIEIYNDIVIDLLNATNEASFVLDVDEQGYTNIHGVSKLQCLSYDDVIKYLKFGLSGRNKKRLDGHLSSLSHVVFTFHVYKFEGETLVKYNKLVFIDLTANESENLIEESIHGYNELYNSSYQIIYDVIANQYQFVPNYFTAIHKYLQDALSVRIRPRPGQDFVNNMRSIVLCCISNEPLFANDVNNCVSLLSYIYNLYSSPAAAFPGDGISKEVFINYLRNKQMASSVGNATGNQGHGHSHNNLDNTSGRNSHSESNRGSHVDGRNTDSRGAFSEDSHVVGRFNNVNKEIRGVSNANSEKAQKGTNSFLEGISQYQQSTFFQSQNVLQPKFDSQIRLGHNRGVYADPLHNVLQNGNAIHPTIECMQTTSTLPMGSRDNAHHISGTIQDINNTVGHINNRINGHQANSHQKITNGSRLNSTNVPNFLSNVSNFRQSVVPNFNESINAPNLNLHPNVPHYSQHTSVPIANLCSASPSTPCSVSSFNAVPDFTKPAPTNVSPCDRKINAIETRKRSTCRPSLCKIDEETDNADEEQESDKGDSEEESDENDSEEESGKSDVEGKEKIDGDQRSENDGSVGVHGHGSSEDSDAFNSSLVSGSISSDNEGIDEDLRSDDEAIRTESECENLEEDEDVFIEADKDSFSALHVDENCSDTLVDCTAVGDRAKLPSVSGKDDSLNDLDSAFDTFKSGKKCSSETSAGRFNNEEKLDADNDTSGIVSAYVMNGVSDGMRTDDEVSSDLDDDSDEMDDTKSIPTSEVGSEEGALLEALEMGDTQGAKEIYEERDHMKCPNWTHNQVEGITHFQSKEGMLECAMTRKFETVEAKSQISNTHNVQGAFVKMPPQGMGHNLSLMANEAHPMQLLERVEHNLSLLSNATAHNVMPPPQGIGHNLRLIAKETQTMPSVERMRHIPSLVSNDARIEPLKPAVDSFVPGSEEETVHTMDNTETEYTEDSESSDDDEEQLDDLLLKTKLDKYYANLDNKIHALNSNYLRNIFVTIKSNNSSGPCGFQNPTKDMSSNSSNQNVNQNQSNFNFSSALGPVQQVPCRSSCYSSNGTANNPHQPTCQTFETVYENSETNFHDVAKAYVDDNLVIQRRSDVNQRISDTEPNMLNCLSKVNVERNDRSEKSRQPSPLTTQYPTSQVPSNGAFNHEDAKDVGRLNHQQNSVYPVHSGSYHPTTFVASPSQRHPDVFPLSYQSPVLSPLTNNPFLTDQTVKKSFSPPMAKSPVNLSYSHGGQKVMGPPDTSISGKHCLVGNSLHTKQGGPLGSLDLVHTPFQASPKVPSMFQALVTDSVQSPNLLSDDQRIVNPKKTAVRMSPLGGDTANFSDVGQECIEQSVHHTAVNNQLFPHGTSSTPSNVPSEGVSLQLSHEEIPGTISGPEKHQEKKTKHTKRGSKRDPQIHENRKTKELKKGKTRRKEERTVSNSVSPVETANSDEQIELLSKHKVGFNVNGSEKGMAMETCTKILRENANQANQNKFVENSMAVGKLTIEDELLTNIDRLKICEEAFPSDPIHDGVLRANELATPMMSPNLIGLGVNDVHITEQQYALSNNTETISIADINPNFDNLITGDVILQDLKEQSSQSINVPLKSGIEMNFKGSSTRTESSKAFNFKGISTQGTNVPPDPGLDNALSSCEFAQVWNALDTTKASMNVVILDVDTACERINELKQLINLKNNLLNFLVSNKPLREEVRAKVEAKTVQLKVKLKRLQQELNELMFMEKKLNIEKLNLNFQKNRNGGDATKQLILFNHLNRMKHDGEPSSSGKNHKRMRRHRDMDRSGNIVEHRDDTFGKRNNTALPWLDGGSGSRAESSLSAFVNKYATPERVPDMPGASNAHLLEGHIDPVSSSESNLSATISRLKREKEVTESRLRNLDIITKITVQSDEQIDDLTKNLSKWTKRLTTFEKLVDSEKAKKEQLKSDLVLNLYKIRSMEETFNQDRHKSEVLHDISLLIEKLNPNGLIDLLKQDTDVSASDKTVKRSNDGSDKTIKRSNDSSSVTLNKTLGEKVDLLKEKDDENRFTNSHQHHNGEFKLHINGTSNNHCKHNQGAPDSSKSKEEIIDEGVNGAQRTFVGLPIFEKKASDRGQFDDTLTVNDESSTTQQDPFANKCTNTDVHLGCAFETRDVASLMERSSQTEDVSLHLSLHPNGHGHVGEQLSIPTRNSLVRVDHKHENSCDTKDKAVFEMRPLSLPNQELLKQACRTCDNCMTRDVISKKCDVIETLMNGSERKLDNLLETESSIDTLGSTSMRNYKMTNSTEISENAISVTAISDKSAGGGAVCEKRKKKSSLSRAFSFRKSHNAVNSSGQCGSTDRSAEKPGSEKPEKSTTGKKIKNFILNKSGDKNKSNDSIRFKKPDDQQSNCSGQSNYKTGGNGKDNDKLSNSSLASKLKFMVENNARNDPVKGEERNAGHLTGEEKKNGESSRSSGGSNGENASQLYGHCQQTQGNLCNGQSQPSGYHEPYHSSCPNARENIGEHEIRTGKADVDSFDANAVDVKAKREAMKAEIAKLLDLKQIIVERRMKVFPNKCPDQSELNRKLFFEYDESIETIDVLVEYKGNVIRELDEDFNANSKRGDQYESLIATACRNGQRPNCTGESVVNTDRNSHYRQSTDDANSFVNGLIDNPIANSHSNTFSVSSHNACSFNNTLDRPPGPSNKDNTCCPNHKKNKSTQNISHNLQCINQQNTNLQNKLGTTNCYGHTPNATYQTNPNASNVAPCGQSNGNHTSRAPTHNSRDNQIQNTVYHNMEFHKEHSNMPLRGTKVESNFVDQTLFRNANVTPNNIRDSNNLVPNNTSFLSPSSAPNTCKVPSNNSFTSPTNEPFNTCKANIPFSVPCTNNGAANMETTPKNTDLYHTLIHKLINLNYNELVLVIYKYFNRIVDLRSTSVELEKLVQSLDFKLEMKIANEQEMNLKFERLHQHNQISNEKHLTTLQKDYQTKLHLFYQCYCTDRTDGPHSRSTSPTGVEENTFLLKEENKHLKSVVKYLEAQLMRKQEEEAGHALVPSSRGVERVAQLGTFGTGLGSNKTITMENKKMVISRRK